MSPDWSAKEDPIPYATMDDPQSLNLYGYVRNSPMSHVDADGHCPWCIPALAGVGVLGESAEVGGAAGALAGPPGIVVGVAVGALIGGGILAYEHFHEDAQTPAATAAPAPAETPAPASQAPTGAYDVGPAGDLKGNSQVGDGLDVHHVPQSQPAGRIISGYNKETAPAIAVPKGENINRFQLGKVCNSQC